MRMSVEEAKRAADEALQRLAKELEAGHSERLKAYLRAMARFHRYSLRNQLLIVEQRPDATQVAGFTTWRRLGRSIISGQHGIAILAPLLSTRRWRDARIIVGAEEIRRERVVADELIAKTPLTRERDTAPEAELIGFRTAFVFDVAQTTGAPLAELGITGGDPGPFLERLHDFCTQRGITVNYSKDILPAYGISSRGKILLAPLLSSAEEFSTLAHEIGHELLHQSFDSPPSNRTVRETEAEAVAFTVCSAIGLQAADASRDYIHLWQGDAKGLASSLERIRTTTATILDGIITDL